MTSCKEFFNLLYMLVYLFRGAVNVDLRIFSRKCRKESSYFKSINSNQPDISYLLFLCKILYAICNLVKICQAEIAIRQGIIFGMI